MASPAEEDDLGRPHFVRFDDDYTHTTLAVKGKVREITPSPTPSDEPDAVGYPPMSEDAEETRRVEENLRRWEIAERQRRKAARGSSTSSATSPSLVDDVSRRASALWAGRKSRGSSLGGLGTHAPLQSQEDNTDTVPLTNINNTPSPSPTRSDFDEPSSSNPFATSADKLPSPFADPQQTAIRLNSSSTPSNTLQHTKSLSIGSTRNPLPPQPLNLPPPRTPPPIILSSPSTSTPSLEDRDKDTKEVRWWHEWLCGCGEGPDRGGDNQAGRTNPFE